MLNFHKPSIKDYSWISPILYPADLPGADNTFCSMYFWESYYGDVAEVEGFVTQRLCQNGCCTYLFPAGCGDVRPALDALLRDAREMGCRLCLRGVTSEKKELLDTLYPGKFSFTPYRDSFDYIYTVEELTGLHGKKLQAKRNHCNRFESDHPDWKTEPITESNIDLCRRMLETWYSLHDPSDQLSREKVALARAFDCFTEANMDGLMLLDAGEVIAFSMGARMNERYYDVCFEKAFPSINGAYAMINREFSRMIAEKYPAVEFLNREDDMGDPGLRKAKESYQPTCLLEKYNACYQEEL